MRWLVYGKKSDHPFHRNRADPGTLAAAVDFLGGTQGTTSAASSRERSFRSGLEERDLESWARQAGRCIESMPLWLSGLEMGGQEHRVLDLDPHYLKATYSGQFGFTVVAGPVYPGLAAATLCSLPSTCTEDCADRSL